MNKKINVKPNSSRQYVVKIPLQVSYTMNKLRLRQLVINQDSE